MQDQIVRVDYHFDIEKNKNQALAYENTEQLRAHVKTTYTTRSNSGQQYNANGRLSLQSKKKKSS